MLGSPLRRCLVSLCTLAVMLALHSPAAAQQHSATALRFASEVWDATFFYPGGTYEAQVPTPEAVLGFTVGSRPACYDEIRRYFETLDAASPRALLVVHGRTHEGRDGLREGLSVQVRYLSIQLKIAQIVQPVDPSSHKPVGQGQCTYRG